MARAPKRSYLWPRLDRLINFVDNWDPGNDTGPATTLALWRRRVFYAAFITAILGGMVSYLPTLAAALRQRFWFTLLGYSLAYLVCVGVVFLRGIPFKLRVLLGLGIIYLAGVLNLDLAGLMGSGRIWLFFFSILTCVMLGLRMGLASLALNLATLGVFYYLLDAKAPGWDALMAQHGYAKAWVMTGVTFGFLSLVAVIAAALVLRGLRASLAEAQDLHRQVEQKKNRMEEINQVLRQEMAERHRAEDTLLHTARDLEQANRELQAEMAERHRAEERLQGLNRCLLSFGSDPIANINRLTKLCGQMLGADAALYNRLQGEMLHSVGTWNIPPDLSLESQAQGHLCHQVIRSPGDGPLVVTNLQDSPYAQTDPNVKAHGLKTYAGQPVMVDQKTMGSMCVVYQEDVEPGPGDLELLATVAIAVGVEELRRLSEQRLKESRQQMQAVFNTVSTGLVLIDAKTHRIVNLNPAAAAAIGDNREQVVGRRCHGFICEAKEGMCPITDQGEHLDKSERVLVTALGERRNILKSATSVMLGGREHLIESFVDITDRKQAEERLRQSEEKYRTILEQMEDGYFEVNMAGDFVFFNDSICRISGYSPQEIAGSNFRDYTNPDQASRIYHTFKEVSETGQRSRAFDWQIRNKSGNVCYLHSTISLMSGPDGEPLGFRGVAQDVTESRQAERLRQEKLKAELASQAKSQFLANMSHEIRTPINGIIGMAELMQNAKLSEDQLRYVDVINSEADSLLSIVNDILDLSKMEAGRLEMEQITFDLRLTMEELADSLAHRAARRGLDFSSFVSPDIPAKLVGDAARLRQVINNLAVNALKFTPSGEIAIRALLPEDLGHAARVRFEVEDTGVGISPDKQAAIFDSFTQADASTTRVFGGTGLGTTIAKQLVELMGGRIGVSSQVGKGSLFWAEIAFPLARTGTDPGHRPQPVLAGRKALVVDDRDKERSILHLYLAHWGCAVQEASGGQEALDLLAQMGAGGGPDVILLDIHMPAMDGFELAGQIWRQGLAPGVPIIAMSSTASLGNGQRCRRLGIEGYLTKPIKQSELRRQVDKVLELTGRPPEEAGVVGRGGRLGRASGRPASVLVVEDYPTNQQVVARHLQRAGMAVEIAGDGRAGVRAFENGSFDVILMDIQMPVMDGYQATGQIREIEKQRPGQGPSRIPIIAMTAHAMKGYRQRCQGAGMDDYLTKPFRKSDLLGIIDKWAPGPGPARTRPPEQPDPPALAATDHAPMNFEQAVDEFEGDKELVVELLNAFLATAGKQLDQMRTALAQGRVEPVRDHAHSIKGGSANLTAMELSAAAAALEQAAKEGALSADETLLDTLAEELDRLADHLQTLPPWAQRPGAKHRP